MAKTTTTKKTAREIREADARRTNLEAFKRYVDSRKRLHLLPAGIEAYVFTRDDKLVADLVSMRDEVVYEKEQYGRKLAALLEYVTRAIQATERNQDAGLSQTIASQSTEVAMVEVNLKAKMSATARFAKIVGWFVPEVLFDYDRCRVESERSITVTETAGVFELTMLDMAKQEIRRTFETEYAAWECAALYVNRSLR